jgi:putative oxidoreductase
MTARAPSIAPLPLRLMLGFGFLHHGYTKLFVSHQQDRFVELFHGIGIPGPEALVYLVGGIEMLGGLALILGTFVTTAAIILIVEMAIAIFTFHLPYGFAYLHIVAVPPEGPIIGPPGFEVPLLYIAGLLALMLSGPGALALGGRKKEKRRF